VDASYFTLFNLQPRFALCPDELDTAYRTLAARVHPDRFVQADDRQRRDAMILATRANEAYRTLRKPLLRARHLLELRGVPTGERGGALPPELLMEHFELREAFENARRSGSPAELSAMHDAVRQRSSALHGRLAAQLDVEQDNRAAAATVLQLMFIEKLVSEIADALETVKS
jgi:molecular chaperone HscB